MTPVVHPMQPIPTVAQLQTITTTHQVQLTNTVRDPLLRDAKDRHDPGP